MSSKEVIVSISLGGEDVRVGKLWFHIRGSRESSTFEYDKKWLEHPERFSLEPALNLTEGAFHTKQGINIFGAIGDSAPDRWGRVLIDLPNLLSAAERFIEDNESAADLKLLLAPGSSLGGARPKASVRDKDGSLAIAKFSRKDDEFNVVIWETVALTLAKKAGIKVSLYRLETILEKPVLIIKRFDRKDRERIPFLSAMSMISALENEQHSYLEIAYALAQNGAAPKEDMAELWRRIVFTIMISNTDDHLRNHAFIYERYKGWRLSPAYDLNPTPIEIKPRILTTAIDFYDTSASLETALSVVKEFRLKKEDALQIIKEVRSAVMQWREVASEFGLSKRECDTMSSAFVYEVR